jgi:hypothetical protein
VERPRPPKLAERRRKEEGGGDTHHVLDDRDEFREALNASYDLLPSGSFKQEGAQPMTNSAKRLLQFIPTLFKGRLIGAMRFTQEPHTQTRRLPDRFPRTIVRHRNCAASRIERPAFDRLFFIIRGASDGVGAHQGP